MASDIVPHGICVSKMKTNCLQIGLGFERWTTWLLRSWPARHIQGIEVNVQVELRTSDDPQCSVLGPELFNMSHLHRQ